MALRRRAERSRADRAMPRARGPDGRARERCLPGRPPVPAPARPIGSPPRRPRHAAARESAPRSAAVQSVDTESLLLLYYGGNAESASERALVLRVRNVPRFAGAAHGVRALRHAVARRLRAPALRTGWPSDIVAIRAGPAPRSGGRDHARGGIHSALARRRPALGEGRVAQPDRVVQGA